MPRIALAPELTAQPKRGYEFVYSLTCPVGGMVRYVGRTSVTLAARLSLHMSQLTAKKQPNAELLYWKQELHSAGLRPIITLLEELPRIDVDSAERMWTRHYQKLGNPMLNIRNLLLAESANGHNLWELNALADKHAMDALSLTVATGVCMASIVGFLSGAKKVSTNTSDLVAKFLHSLPPERLTEEPRYLAYKVYHLPH